MSSNTNLELFDAIVKIETESEVSAQNLSSLVSNVLSIFSSCFQNQQLNGIDPSLYKFVKTFSLSICLINDDEMIRINRQYRNQDKTTDVLSFPVHEDLRSIDHSTILKTETFLLGDVIISYPVAKKQAEEAGISINTELVELIIHGVLHLLGYDHEISDDEQAMMYGLEEHIFDLYKEKK